MSLEESLAKLRQLSKERYGEERNKMVAAMQEQKESGIVERAIKVGDKLPAFALPNTKGEIVTSDDLLSQGAVVLTVFRGHW
ncbi:MAG: hypothetical protein O7A03_06205 [Alphaproteobacteria bacterium]|nr:hypothetical protein [Alphaproteobacteria bacterium]